MAPLPAPAEKPSHRVSDSQSHAKVRPPTQVAVFCAALWPNLQPALTVGFRVVRTKFAVMVVSGFLAAIGGVLMAGYVQAGFFQLGRGIELDAIAAAVIGGVALFGGRGSIIGAMWGVLVIGVLNTGLLLLEAQTNVQLIAKGGLVVIALAFGEYVRLRASNA